MKHEREHGNTKGNIMKRAYIKIIIDIVMTLAVLALMEPKATGLSLHEWGGLAICLIFLIHNLINWKWIACVTGKFFKKLPVKNRVNYVLDAVLLLGFAAIVLSGMAIAKTIDFSWLPLGGTRFFWRSLHVSASLLTLAAVGVHVGLHWKWIDCQFGNIRKEVAHV
jgi:hypothetical protein